MQLSTYFCFQVSSLAGRTIYLIEWIECGILYVESPQSIYALTCWTFLFAGISSLAPNRNSSVSRDSSRSTSPCSGSGLSSIPTPGGRGVNGPRSQSLGDRHRISNSTSTSSCASLASSASNRSASAGADKRTAIAGPTNKNSMLDKFKFFNSKEKDKGKSSSKHASSKESEKRHSGGSTQASPMHDPRCPQARGQPGDHEAGAAGGRDSSPKQMRGLSKKTFGLKGKREGSTGPIPVSTPEVPGMKKSTPAVNGTAPPKSIPSGTGTKSKISPTGNGKGIPTSRDRSVGPKCSSSKGLPQPSGLKSSKASSSSSNVSLASSSGIPTPGAGSGIPAPGSGSRIPNSGSRSSSRPPKDERSIGKPPSNRDRSLPSSASNHGLQKSASSHSGHRSKSAGGSRQSAEREHSRMADPSGRSHHSSDRSGRSSSRQNANQANGNMINYQQGQQPSPHHQSSHHHSQDGHRSSHQQSADTHHQQSSHHSSQGSHSQSSGHESSRSHRSASKNRPQKVDGDTQTQLSMSNRSQRSAPAGQPEGVVSPGNEISTHSNSSTSTNLSTENSSTSNSHSASSNDSVIFRPSSCDEMSSGLESDSNLNSKPRDHISALRQNSSNSPSREKDSQKSCSSPKGKKMETTFDKEVRTETKDQQQKSGVRETTIGDDNEELIDIKPMQPILRSTPYSYLRSLTTGPLPKPSLHLSSTLGGGSQHSASSRLGINRPLIDPTKFYHHSMRRTASSGGSALESDYASDTDGVDISAGYMSDGDVLRGSHVEDISSGYMSEGGASLYAKRMQQRFREGMQAVRECMQKSSGMIDDDR